MSLAVDTATLTGTPADVHKIYLIEPRLNTSSGANKGLQFTPLDYNDHKFRAARTSGNVDPSNVELYYAITGQGAPVGAPTVHIAPKVNSAIAAGNVRFCYVPVLATTDLEAGDNVPIPGEADNALIAWTVAFARAKERDDRSPDPSWLTIYSTEKAHLMHSLGLRQYQEVQIVDAIFEDSW